MPTEIDKKLNDAEKILQLGKDLRGLRKSIERMNSSDYHSSIVFINTKTKMRESGVSVNRQIIREITPILEEEAKSIEFQIKGMIL